MSYTTHHQIVIIGGGKPGITRDFKTISRSSPLKCSAHRQAWLFSLPFESPTVATIPWTRPDGQIHSSHWEY